MDARLLLEEFLRKMTKITPRRKRQKKLQSNVKSQKSEKEFEENGDENKNFNEMDDVKKYIKTHKKETVSPSDKTFKK